MLKKTMLRKHSYFFTAAFTLTELLIVIVIIGILAAIVYPRFARTIEVARGREARVSLELILSAEQIILLQTGSYASCTDTADCNTQLNLDLRGNNWDYDVTVTAPPGPTFLATATRTGGLFPGTITIDQTGPPLGGTWLLLGLL